MRYRDDANGVPAGRERSLRPVAQQLVIASTANQDRAAVFERADRLVLAIADGAGGTGDGAAAADAVIGAVELAVSCNEPCDWVALLRQVDRQLLDRGWTTAVVVEASGGLVAGASVGDSRAWLYGKGRCNELTEHQRRKPLLGSGDAIPVGFDTKWSDEDMLFLATDGLCDYLSMSEIGRMALQGKALGELLERIRLPRGGFPDDVAIISCCLVDDSVAQP